MPTVRRVSLIPLSPRVTKVRLTGDFKYPLNDEDLLLGLTRGLSNELGPDGGNIFLTSGQLIVTVSPLHESGPGFKKKPEAMLTWKGPKKEPSQRSRKNTDRTSAPKVAKTTKPAGGTAQKVAPDSPKKASPKKVF
jgi:hypothetical protein